MREKNSNPSTQEADVWQVSVNSRLAWSTEWEEGEEGRRKEEEEGGGGGEGGGGRRRRRDGRGRGKKRRSVKKN